MRWPVPPTSLVLACTVAFALHGSRCVVDFSSPGPGPDGQPDANIARDVGVPSDGATDASLDAAKALDAGSDAAPPVPDGGCPPDSKECAATCVSVTDPQLGCAAQSCEPCAYDHAEAQCVAGACGMGSCEGAWRDCDLDPATGCEIDVANDARNCGSCGHGCSLPHVNMGCQNSVCQFLSCVGDWRDCDGNVQTNGCETDTSADDLNCGACGTVCASGFYCSYTACRCSTSNDCDTGGGGTCDSGTSLCRCPIAWCQGPCHPSGSGCL